MSDKDQAQRTMICARAHRGECRSKTCDHSHLHEEVKYNMPCRKQPANQDCEPCIELNAKEEAPR